MDTTSIVVDEIHVIVLADSLDAAKKYMMRKVRVIRFTYSSKVEHGKYIVGSTFYDTDSGN